MVSCLHRTIIPRTSDTSLEVKYSVSGRCNTKYDIIAAGELLHAIHIQGGAAHLTKDSSSPQKQDVFLLHRELFPWAPGVTSESISTTCSAVRALVLSPFFK